MTCKKAQGYLESNAVQVADRADASNDRKADLRAPTFQIQPSALLVDVDSYLDHETWIRPAFAQLGDLNGRHVLDFGCGHGMAAVTLAKLGARVTAFDLSPGYLQEAR